MKKTWKDKMWIITILYFSIGFFNIMFAWFGMVCFLVPLFMSIFGMDKAFCNTYCGRGQLFALLGNDKKLSLNKSLPSFLRSKWFRYGFLFFFMLMFFNMLFATWTVLTGSGGLNESIKLLWSFDVPWRWANRAGDKIPLWTVQFAYGFYSLMLTSLILGLISMAVYRARSWCVYCPIGTATQAICKLREGEKL